MFVIQSMQSKGIRKKASDALESIPLSKGLNDVSQEDKHKSWNDIMIGWLYWVLVLKDLPNTAPGWEVQVMTKPASQMLSEAQLSPRLRRRSQGFLEVAK